MKNEELAARGVEAAKEFLARRGYEIMTVDYVCDAGQIDIIAYDPKCEAIVFTEVMTRKYKNATQGFPGERTNKTKRDRLEKVAADYLAQTEGLDDVQVRFDVISILVLDGSKAFLRHHINAFGEMTAG